MFRFWNKNKEEELEAIEEIVDISERLNYLKSLLVANFDQVLANNYLKLINKINEVESSQFYYDETITPSSPISEIGGHIYNEILSDHIKYLESEFDKDKETWIKILKEELTIYITDPERIKNHYLTVFVPTKHFIYRTRSDWNTQVRELNVKHIKMINKLETNLRDAGIEIRDN